MLSRDAEAGDIIFVPRTLGYTHYAIYAGNQKVIHYNQIGNDNNCIQRGTLKDFLGDDTSYSIRYFPATEEDMCAFLKNAKLSSSYLRQLKDIGYRFYSPEETLERAESKLGEASYNVFFNNCEHFVMWCKTGMAQSSQADHFFAMLYNATPGMVRTVQII